MFEYSNVISIQLSEIFGLPIDISFPWSVRTTITIHHIRIAVLIGIVCVLHRPQR